MKLLKSPAIPKEIIVGRKNKFNRNVPDEWKDYLGA